MSLDLNTFSRDIVLSPAGVSFFSAVNTATQTATSEDKSLSDFGREVFSRVPFFEVFYTNVVMLAPRVVFLAYAFVAVVITPDYTRHLEKSLAGVVATIVCIGMSILGLIDPLQARESAISSLGQFTRTPDSFFFDDYHRGLCVIAEALGRLTANYIS